MKLTETDLGRLAKNAGEKGLLAWRIQSSTTAAKVGYYLQRHAEALMVEDRHLNPLRQLRPAQPHYLERGKRGKLVGDWNLVVPPSLDGKTWEETR